MIAGGQNLGLLSHPDHINDRSLLFVLLPEQHLLVMAQMVTS